MKQLPHIIILLSLVPCIAVAGTAVPELKNLNPSDGAMKSIRNDIRKGIYVVKSGRPEGELPELKFYAYTVKRGDTFWSIIARSSLDMDTLISVNRLSTPRDITPGRRIFLPNMRGIIMRGGDEKAIDGTLREQMVAPGYVHRANRCSAFDRKHLFVPCAKLSNLERSLFIGTGFAYPLPSRGAPRISSGFGTRRNPFDRGHVEFHAGVDISCPRGSEALAARDGKVVFTGYEGGYGNLVVIEHEYGFRSYYGHLSRPLVRPGDRVRRGAAIGLTGNTGRTTGPHLHFEVRRGSMPVHPGVLLKG